MRKLTVTIELVVSSFLHQVNAQCADGRPNNNHNHINVDFHIYENDNGKSVSIITIKCLGADKLNRDVLELMNQNNEVMFERILSHSVLKQLGGEMLISEKQVKVKLSVPFKTMN